MTVNRDRFLKIFYAPNRPWPVKLLKKLRLHWVRIHIEIISLQELHVRALGLLDQPVLIEGKRKRKATKQYNIEASVPKKRVAAKHVGSGTKLQDIPSGITFLIK